MQPIYRAIAFTRTYFVDEISVGVPMQVCKWGNSLAIRLPASVVQALQLKEGDEIEVRVVGHRAFNVDRDRSRSRDP